MTTLRGPGVKSVGKPDAGNRHVRFDERGRETGLLAPRPSSTLPKALMGYFIVNSFISCSKPLTYERFLGSFRNFPIRECVRR
jgi:hypothetical protein